MKNLSNLNEILRTESSSEQSEKRPETGKRQFVEPEISVPVDVLEATTFFQSTDSGGTLEPN